MAIQPNNIIFAKQTIEFVRDCGGDGYSWWDFIDGCVPWGSPFAILRQDRSEKPIVEVFRSFKADEFGNTCYKPFNYYDHYGLTPFEVHGYIYDQATNAKIENAVIQGWDASWNNSCSTYSDQDGYYSLKSSHPINIMTAVAIKSHTQEISGNFTNQDFYLQRFQPADLYLTGSLSNTDYAATGSIYSLNVYTSANNTLNLKAGERIVLMTGFHSEENSYGRYQIEDFFTDCAWVQTNYRMHSSDENPSKENTKNNNIAEFVHSKLESAVIVHAYPNPVSDQLTVEFDTPVTVTILLMNVSNNYLVEEK
ncbi:MAG: hypothetical protein IPP34_16590 [Bacteroidetes bacterium]|nr:hypothetical protein [Bacteroidota bacterium]